MRVVFLISSMAASGGRELALPVPRGKKIPLVPFYFQ